MELLVAGVMALLKVIEVAAPSVAAAITGGQSVDEAAANARKAQEALPDRERGDAGTWDRDLDERKKRG